MKRILEIAFFSTATFITFGSALAKAQSRIIEAKVPFAFIVRNQLLPAGIYRISSMEPNLVQIKAIDKAAITSVATQAYDSKREGQGELVFNKYGDQYFLRKVLCERATISVQLPASKLEESARSRETRPHSTDRAVAAVR